MGANTLRCKICDRTNNPDVATVPENYLRGGRYRFREDTAENGFGHICYRCDEAVTNWNNEYEID